MLPLQVPLLQGLLPSVLPLQVLLLQELLPSVLPLQVPLLQGLLPSALPLQVLLLQELLPSVLPLQVPLLPESLPSALPLQEFLLPVAVQRPPLQVLPRPVAPVLPLQVLSLLLLPRDLPWSQTHIGQTGHIEPWSLPERSQGYVTIWIFFLSSYFISPFSFFSVFG